MPGQIVVLPRPENRGAREFLQGAQVGTSAARALLGFKELQQREKEQSSLEDYRQKLLDLQWSAQTLNQLNTVLTALPKDLKPQVLVRFAATGPGKKLLGDMADALQVAQSSTATAKRLQELQSKIIETKYQYLQEHPDEVARSELGLPSAAEEALTRERGALLEATRKHMGEPPKQAPEVEREAKLRNDLLKGLIEGTLDERQMEVARALFKLPADETAARLQSRYDFLTEHGFPEPTAAMMALGFPPSTKKAEDFGDRIRDARALGVVDPEGSPSANLAGLAMVDSLGARTKQITDGLRRAREDPTSKEANMWRRVEMRAARNPVVQKQKRLGMDWLARDIRFNDLTELEQQQWRVSEFAKMLGKGGGARTKPPVAYRPATDEEINEALDAFPEGASDKDIEGWLNRNKGATAYE